jgi:hypothetical protein
MKVAGFVTLGLVGGTKVFLVWVIRFIVIKKNGARIEIQPRF